jgi:lipopolysaccharide heptosyltransferase I
VRLSALGDLVHAIPVAAALRRVFPSARIDWLVGARYKEILDLVPVIDHRIAIGDGGPGNAGQSAWVVLRELRRVRYDAAIDLQGLIKSAALARGSGARRVVGFAGRQLREPLARLFYTDAHDVGSRGVFDRSDQRHVVTLNLEILRALGIEPGDPEFPLGSVSVDVARRVLQACGGRYALINPGAGWPNKRWPPSRFGFVAAALRREHGLQSIVLWGPGERALADEVAAASDGAATPAPPTTVADVVALCRSAAVVVSGDTGPAHISAAVGAPIVGIFGPTRPERNGPLRADDVSVSRAAACQCHHRRRCRLDAPCLLDITVDEVTRAVEQRLATAAAGD